MNKNAAATSPTSIATTRSNTTVRTNVNSKTIISDLGDVLIKCTNFSKPHMLYATWKSIAAMQGIGISFASGIRRTSTRTSVNE